jgi:hypothetical protein
MAEYMTLLMKITINNLSNEKAKKTLSLKLWFAKHVGACYILFPFLQFVHNFVKFNILKDVFVCDFVVIIKVCQRKIFSLYAN